MITPDFTDAKWRKAIASDSGGCVEVAYVEGVIGVRDTKQNGTGPILAFNEREWTAFLTGVASGEFTLDELSR